ncbi:MAG: hypothetical protein R2883_03500, partial [Caldisericia bacterium]
FQYPELAGEKDIEFIISDVLTRAEKIKFESSDAKKRWVKGRAVRSLYGRVHGKKISDLIDNKLN